ncbi:TadE family type IV pilus minor pilin [Streptomyces sp. NPDC005336]|uniref:TadE family type IV pilus minor pilin n=1 Tax=Streptomyces sp. NPDC005336 TaxID=3157035 RepID=UPI0033B16B3F
MRSSETPERVGQADSRAAPGARGTPRTSDSGPDRDLGSDRGLVADRGFVTAEAAVALPVLALFALMLIWGLMAASAQLQCVDAARAGARAAARSESRAAAVAAARSAAPRGARVELWREGDLVRVRVRTHAAGPGALAVSLRGEAAALAEDTVGEPAGAVGTAREAVP